MRRLTPFGAHFRTFREGMVIMGNRYFRFIAATFRVTAIVCITALTAIMSTGDASAALIVYQAPLSGPNEAPPNASPGIGNAKITIDTVLVTMRVEATFSGLTGNTTASHIHCCTANARAATAGVATTTPTFSGFPSGVTSGTYTQTFDMQASGSYNAAFITANGGTTSSAFAALLAGMAAGKAYFNIHSSTFGGGEIRGFLERVPTLDVDNSFTATRYHALTDGLLLIRYMQGLSGPALTAGLSVSGAGRSDATSIKAYMDAYRMSFDIDNNTNVDAATDGILIVRYLLGLRGNALIQGAVAPGAPRSTAVDIEAYLSELTP